MGCPGDKLRSGGRGKGLGIGKGEGPVGRRADDEMFDRIVDPKVGKSIKGKGRLL